MTEADPIYRLATELARELEQQREHANWLSRVAAEGVVKLADQRAMVAALAERLANASEVLSRVAEKGRFCAKCASELKE